MTLKKETRIIIAAQLLTIAGLIVLWTARFSGFWWAESNSDESPEKYTVLFDHLSPFPDAILMVALALACLSLIKNNPRGKLLSNICGFYLIFLGVIDYALPIGGQRVAISIIDTSAIGILNLWCIVLGLYTFLKLRKSPKEVPTE